MWKQQEVPEGGLVADLCQVCERFFADADPLGLSANLDDLKTTASSAMQKMSQTLAPTLRFTCFISWGVYSMVRIIVTLSSKSRGIPCGELMSSVPLRNNGDIFKLWASVPFNGWVYF